MMPVRYRGGTWEYETFSVEVRVMAEAENYAMVRRKGCVPFVVPVKELSTLHAGKKG